MLLKHKQTLVYILHDDDN